MSKKLRAAHGDLLSNLHVLVPLRHARGPTSLDSISVWKWLITSNLSIAAQYNSLKMPTSTNLSLRKPKPPSREYWSKNANILGEDELRLQHPSKCHSLQLQLQTKWRTLIFHCWELQPRAHPHFPEIQHTGYVRNPQRRKLCIQTHLGYSEKRRLKSTIWGATRTSHTAAIQRLFSLLFLCMALRPLYGWMVGWMTKWTNGGHNLIKNKKKP